MAIFAVPVSPTDRWITGLSTDPKPDLPLEDVTTMFMEIDTGNTFQWTGSFWIHKTLKGAIDVHDADPHQLVVNEYFHRHTGVSTVLATSVLAGTSVLPVVDASIFTVGDEIQINNGNVESTFPEITAISISPALLYLDRPIDFSYPATTTTIEIIETNMAVVGSIGSPVSFKMIPHGGQVWHLTRFLLAVQCATAADDSVFGDLPRLTNGCTLRGYSGQADQYITFTNWKSNGDGKMDMFDVQYTDKAGPGLFGVNGRGTIKDGTGAVPELSDDNGDFMELLIQDDISALPLFRLKGQGHVAREHVT